jgi:hypothetical protein
MGPVYIQLLQWLHGGSCGYLLVPVATLRFLCLSSGFSGYMVIPVAS